MFEISKGDGVFDLAELVLELFGRAIGKVLGRSTPSEPLASWGWPEWLWLAVVLFVVIVLVRYFKRRRSGLSPVELGEATHD